LPPAFGGVMSRALEKRREARYSTAQEFSDALAPFRTQRPAPAVVKRPAREGLIAPREAPRPMPVSPPAENRAALPKVKLFTSVEDSSSFSNSDEEPTQEIEAKARKTFVNEEGSSDDETPIYEENDPTVADLPRFQDHDILTERRRR
jgi:hypothetical protein